MTIFCSFYATVPFAEPFNITKKVVELLYMREINVINVLEGEKPEKPTIINVLKMLKVAGIDESFKPQGEYVNLL